MVFNTKNFILKRNLRRRKFKTVRIVSLPLSILRVKLLKSLVVMLINSFYHNLFDI